MSLIEEARERSGFTQEALARRAGTSRPTLSAYEHGRKSPTLETTSRLLAAAGFTLEIVPEVRWSSIPGARGQVHHVPDRLLRLPIDVAFARFEAPLHLDWSAAGRVVDLSERRQRRRWYELVIREGSVEDISRYIDGALLIDVWPDIVVPRAVRAAWQETVERSIGGARE